MKLLIFSFLTFYTSIVLAQEKTSKLTYGLKVGLTMSNLSPDYTDVSSGTKTDFRYKRGFTFGARVLVDAGKHFLLMPELSLVGKGSKKYVDYSSGYIPHSPALSTSMEATINLLAKFYSKQTKFMFGGGPSFAVAMDQYREDVGDTDAGINMLAAIQTPIGFSVELNFNKGFKKQTGNIFYGNSKALTTNLFGFCIGYTF